MIRRASVRATAAEKRQPLPGDDLIPDAVGALTHAITIDRPAHDVWPWLVQMGAYPRAGWYSYDVLDNRWHRSARRVIPDLQLITPGMIFPAAPNVTEGFTLLKVETGRHLILGWRVNGMLIVTWVFALVETTPRSCRLIVRVRADGRYQFQRLPRWMSMPIGTVVHFVMQRRQLLGIKQRAEAMPSSAQVRSACGRVAGSADARERSLLHRHA
jgi:hypothetical protein